MKAQTDKYDYMAKVVILGDSAVGKTNILLRYTQQDYKPTHLATVGVDFKIKTLLVGSKKVKMQLWDTAGQERFKTITETYYKGASGIVLVYSISDRKSFNNITSWMTQISQHNQQDLPKIIVGNKCDLPANERVISQAEGKELANKYSVGWLETSARQDTNINEVFSRLGQAIVQRIQKKAVSGQVQPEPKQICQISNTPDKKKEKKNCC